MTHRGRRSSGLWKVREPGEDGQRSPSPVNARTWGCSVCSGPLHPRSPLTRSVLPRWWCGTRLSSRARSTNSPPTATAPRSMASAPSAPARSRAGREWGVMGVCHPTVLWDPTEGGGLEDGGLQCLLPPEPRGCPLRGTASSLRGAAGSAPAVSRVVGAVGVSPPVPPPAGGQASSTVASRASSLCWSAASTRAGRRGAAATPTTWRGCAPSAPSPAP